jgi:hypothetical protein
MAAAVPKSTFLGVASGRLSVLLTLALSGISELPLSVCHVWTDIIRPDAVVRLEFRVSSYEQVDFNECGIILF